MQAIRLQATLVKRRAGAACGLRCPRCRGLPCRSCAWIERTETPGIWLALLADDVRELFQRPL